MTHEEKRERRDEILEELKNGADVQVISEKYGLKMSTIRQYKYNFQIPGPPSKRKQLVAYAQKNGMVGIQGEIERLGLHRSYASMILKDLGHKIPRKKTIKRVVKSSRIFKVIAALQNGATANDVWAEKLGCTRQYIELVQRQCEQEGVKLFNKEAK